MEIRFKRYERVVKRIYRITEKLYKIYNKQLLAEIGYRLSQLCCTLQLIELILNWLNFNCIQTKSSEIFYKNLKMFYSLIELDTIAEPWAFRGGLSAQLRVSLFFKS